MKRLATPESDRRSRTEVREQKIRIDGKSFVDTDFIDCTLVYGGGVGVRFVGCSFLRPRFVFDGPAANTMGLMQAMYRGGAHDLIERMFEEIRGDGPVRRTYN